MRLGAAATVRGGGHPPWGPGVGMNGQKVGGERGVNNQAEHRVLTQRPSRASDGRLSLPGLGMCWRRGDWGWEDGLWSLGSREVSGEAASTPTPGGWAGALEAEGGMRGVLRPSGLAPRWPG